MTRIRRALKEELDRVVTDVLFIVFGVWSFFKTPRSLSTTPEMFVYIFNVEFILIGLILLTGTILRSYRLKVLGFALYIVALVTTAALITVVGNSSVSLLILAFAVRGYTSIKEMRLQQQFLTELRETLRHPED